MKKIALLQMNSHYEASKNLEAVETAAKKSIEEGAEALFLPECFYSMSDGLAATEYLVEGDLQKRKEDEHYQAIQRISQLGIALIGGSAATRDRDNVVNRTYNFSKDGEDLGHYDKINLFSCDIQKENQRKAIDESDIYTPGTEPQLIEWEGIKIGLGICFDLRYPEMARSYVEQGAKILTFSSAFTVPTGRAHWHTLVRARAIENQCFVVACAQVGKHNERIITYGHSLVVDPWGEIILDAKDEEGLFFVELNLERIDEVRKSVKVFKVNM